jgi:hypothetical protein
VAEARGGGEVGEGRRQEGCKEEGWHRLLLELRLVWH